MLDYLMIRNSYTYASLHGGMDLEDRTATVDQFNNDPHMFVFLISTKAGGVGLNIVSANKVYPPYPLSSTFKCIVRSKLESRARFTSARPSFSNWPTS